MTQTQILNRFEQTWRPQINQYLTSALDEDVTETTLQAAMHYSLMAGGKRLRPLLTLATIQLTDQTIGQSQLRAACALELVHTYSLIHDDLPAMDNDTLRRGQPTNHVKFGAGMATLAGDGLLTLAFQWLTDAGLPGDQPARLVHELAHAAGPAGMVAGQAMDIEFQHQTLTMTDLKRLHRQKTGALIRAAVVNGAIMGNVGQPEMPSLVAFAEAFGLAFQIYDDILDVVASTAEMGKVTHKDADEAKNTYPAKLGLIGANDALKSTMASGQAALAALPFDTSLLAAFFSYFDTKRVMA